MTEERIAFLCNIASTIKPSQIKEFNNILRSHYLMKCNEITAGYGLPTKHFSSEARCPRCYLEWSRGSGIKVKLNKLSKKQRRRLKTAKKDQKNVVDNTNLKQSNIMEKTCKFCKHNTVTTLTKPICYNKVRASKANNHIKTVNVTEYNQSKKREVNQKKTENQPTKVQKPQIANVYTKAYEVFSLKNEKNTLASAMKAKPKVINNNKRKKDKFAGLCQKAVLASAKLKQENEKQNKLNLFLKPSSG